MNFGDKLKKVRNERKITQKALGDIIGVKMSTICDWEKNRHKPNDLDVFKKLCDTLNVPSTYFVCENTEVTKLLEDSDFATFLISYAKLSNKDKQSVNNFIMELSN